MMATLGGAVVSDGLADGRVVSGVGGQFNFVAQAHALPGGRSIIAVRATRASGGRVESNIRWNYGHVTIPRHLRDVVLTEYGIADIRGKSDAEVAAAMLAIADSRFQPALLAEAQRAGKLPASLPDPRCTAREPAGAAGARARAAPRGRALRRPALRHRPQPGRGAPRRRSAPARSAFGVLGRAGSASAAALLRPLPRDAESRALFARMGLDSPRRLRKRI